MTRKLTAVYGGAFDPPHQGHIALIAGLLLRDDVDEVWLLPVHQHVFDKRMTAFEIRCQWLSACIERLGWQGRVSVCRVERELAGPSRTYETLNELSRRYSSRSFCFAMGADNLAVADHWYRFDELTHAYPLIVFGRHGYEKVLSEYAHHDWCMVEYTLPHVASSEVKRALRHEPQNCLDIPPPIRRSVLDHFRAEWSVDDHAITVRIMGGGRVGRSLERSFSSRGVNLRVWCRSEETLKGHLSRYPLTDEVIILAVSDGAIQTVASELMPYINDQTILLHCSGATPPVELDQLPADRSGLLHPIMAVADKSSDLTGRVWGLLGGEAAMKRCEVIVDLLQGRSIRIPPKEQASYHASMVFVSNYLVSLVLASETLLTQSTGAAEDVTTPLLDLLGSALESVKRRGARDGLTGPLARGDLETVRRHLDSIERLCPELSALYRAHAIHLAGILGIQTDLQFILADSKSKTPKVR